MRGSFRRVLIIWRLRSEGVSQGGRGSGSLGMELVSCWDYPLGLYESVKVKMCRPLQRVCGSVDLAAWKEVASANGRASCSSKVLLKDDDKYVL